MVVIEIGRLAMDLPHEQANDKSAVPVIFKLCKIGNVVLSQQMRRFIDISGEKFLEQGKQCCFAVD